MRIFDRNGKQVRVELGNPKQSKKGEKDQKDHDDIAEDNSPYITLKDIRSEMGKGGGFSKFSKALTELGIETVEIDGTPHITNKERHMTEAYIKAAKYHGNDISRKRIEEETGIPGYCTIVLVKQGILETGENSRILQSSYEDFLGNYSFILVGRESEANHKMKTLSGMGFAMHIYGGKNSFFIYKKDAEDIVNNALGREEIGIEHLGSVCGEKDMKKLMKEVEKFSPTGLHEHCADSGAVNLYIAADVAKKYRTS